MKAADGLRKRAVVANSILSSRLAAKLAASLLIPSTTLYDSYLPSTVFLKRLILPTPPPSSAPPFSPPLVVNLLLRLPPSSASPSADVAISLVLLPLRL